MEAGRRQIALLHNTPAAFHGRPHLVEKLTEELAEATGAGHASPTRPKWATAVVRY
jgi:hypothetical protein